MLRCKGSARLYSRRDVHCCGESAWPIMSARQFLLCFGSGEVLLLPAAAEHRLQSDPQHHRHAAASGAASTSTGGVLCLQLAAHELADLQAETAASLETVREEKQDLQAALDSTQVGPALQHSD